MSTPEPEQAAPTQPSAEPPGVAPPVDLDALAERVYRLMLAELRREQARGASGARRRER